MIATILVLHLAVNAYGVRGSGTVAIDRATGRFLRRFNAGPASEQEGFDGVRAWRADATGMARDRMRMRCYIHIYEGELQ